MIIILPGVDAAEMRCSEPGCPEREPVELALTVTGGFAFRPDPERFKDWQVGVAGNGTFLAYCKAHKKPEKKLVQAGPAGPIVAKKALLRPH